MTRSRITLLLIAAGVSYMLLRLREALRDADEDTRVLWAHLIDLQTKLNAEMSLTHHLSRALAQPVPASAADALLRRVREEREEELNQHGPNDWRHHA